MKKLLITVLAVFYLGVSSGATVHFHYCMGQLIDWGLTQEQPAGSEECSNCGMSETDPDNCCKNEQQEIKVKDFQKAAANFYQAKIFAAEPVRAAEFFEIGSSDPPELHSQSNALPRTQKNAAFIRYCNFRI